MNSTAIRQKLHDYIDIADEEKLQAMYVLLEADIENSYSAEDIALFHQRRNNHLREESASYNVEESLELVRKQANKDDV